MKNYNRVIPRDFFNEAKLLKCMGLLALKIHDNQAPKGLQVMEELGGENGFKVELTNSSELYVANYPVYFNSCYIFFYTAYNSKSNYPFYCIVKDEEIEVFTEQGEFTAEFLEAFASVSENMEA